MSKLKLVVTVTPLKETRERKELEFHKIRNPELRSKVNDYVNYIELKKVRDPKLKDEIRKYQDYVDSQKETKTDKQDEQRVEAIKYYLVSTMIHYLLAGGIPADVNQKSHLKRISRNLYKFIIASNTVHLNNGYVFTIIADTEYASFIEFGTGLHSELSSPHYIRPKLAKVLHWVDDEGSMYLKRTAGQYPKPFMRGAVMRLHNFIELIEGYRVNAQIVFPTSKFNETYEIEELHKGQWKQYEQNTEKRYGDYK